LVAKIIHTPITITINIFYNKGAKKRKNGSDFEPVPGCKQRVQVAGKEHCFTSNLKTYVSIISLRILLSHATLRFSNRLNTL